MHSTIEGGMGPVNERNGDGENWTGLWVQYGNLDY